MREHLVIYIAIWHVRYILKEREYTIIIDHRPLNYVLYSRPGNYSPREKKTSWLHFTISFGHKIYIESEENCSRRNDPYFHILSEYGNVKFRKYRRRTKQNHLHFCKLRRILYFKFPYLFRAIDSHKWHEKRLPRPYMPPKLRNKFLNRFIVHHILAHKAPPKS